MTISERVQKQFFATDSTEINQQQLIRLPPTVVAQYNARDANPSTHTPSSHRRGVTRGAGRRTNLWSIEEHERFLEGLHRFPRGPWKHVAIVVGTKTVRQTMTHAQKYRQKIERMAKRDSEDADENKSDGSQSKLPEEESATDLARFVDESEMNQIDLQADMDRQGLDPMAVDSVVLDPFCSWDDLLGSVDFDQLSDAMTQDDIVESEVK